MVNYQRINCTGFHLCQLCSWFIYMLNFLSLFLNKNFAYNYRRKNEEKIQSISTTIHKKYFRNLISALWCSQLLEFTVNPIKYFRDWANRIGSVKPYVPHKGALTAVSFLRNLHSLNRKRMTRTEIYKRKKKWKL